MPAPSGAAIRRWPASRPATPWPGLRAGGLVHLPRRWLLDGVFRVGQTLGRRRKRLDGRRNIFRQMALLELVEQLKHPRATLRGLVETDVKLWNALQAKARAELAAYESHRPAQRSQRLVLLGFGADYAHPHARVPQVRRRLDVGHRDEPDPWIGDLSRQDVGDLLPQQLVDPFS